MTTSFEGDSAAHGLVHGDFEVPVPSGWEDGTQVVIVAQPDGDFRPNLVLSHDPRIEEEDAEHFARRHAAQLIEALDGYRIVDEGWTDIGDHRGFLRTHEFVANGQKLRQIQFYLTAPNRMYTFTFTHLTELFQARVAEAHKVISGTRIFSMSPKPAADPFAL